MKGGGARTGLDIVTLKASYLERYAERGPKDTPSTIIKSLGVSHDALGRWMRGDPKFRAEVLAIDDERIIQARETFTRQLPELCAHTVELAMGNTKNAVKALELIFKICKMVGGPGGSRITNAIQVNVPGREGQSIEEIKARQAEIAAALAELDVVETEETTGA